VTRVNRSGRALSGRVAVDLGRRERRCPKCDAAPGWRCTKTVAGMAVPRKNDHPERRRREQTS